MCAETKSVFRRTTAAPNTRKVRISPEGGKHCRHQTVLIETGRSEEDAGSEEAGSVWLPHSGGIIWDQDFKQTRVRPGRGVLCECI